MTSKQVIRTAAGAALILAAAAGLNAQYRRGYQSTWFDAGSGEGLPPTSDYENEIGMVGLVHTLGNFDTQKHPFFAPLGTNGRACITCHQPAYGMSVTAASMEDRWFGTGGQDPVFAAFDGSNCPGLPQHLASSHSLLIHRGLFRIPVAWPPRNPDGSAKPVEFKIEVLRDPTFCNNSPTYGLTSKEPTVSVFRRPRPAANLSLVTAGNESAILGYTNLMADGREATLRTQAISATLGHEQAKVAPTPDQLDRIVDFETRIFMAMSTAGGAGAFNGIDAPEGLGPVALSHAKPSQSKADVFGLFDLWRNPKGAGDREFRASAARGAAIFSGREFTIRDAAHRTQGIGVKGTCATCHNSSMTGQDPASNWNDPGTTTAPTWTEPKNWEVSSQLPVFKITCNLDAAPHPTLGREIITTDPGRALTTGKCADVGAILPQQLRGLAGRAPYFTGGSAKTLRDVVDYYNHRFNMQLTESEASDLTHFLEVL